MGGRWFGLWGVHFFQLFLTHHPCPHTLIFRPLCTRPIPSWPTPRPCIAWRPPKPPSRPSPATNLFNPLDRLPQGGVGHEEAVKAADKDLLCLVAVTPGDAHRPRIPATHRDIYDLFRKPEGKMMNFCRVLFRIFKITINFDICDVERKIKQQRTQNNYN